MGSVCVQRATTINAYVCNRGPWSAFGLGASSYRRPGRKRTSDSEEPRAAFAQKGGRFGAQGPERAGEAEREIAA